MSDTTTATPTAPATVTDSVTDSPAAPTPQAPAPAPTPEGPKPTPVRESLADVKAGARAAARERARTAAGQVAAAKAAEGKAAEGKAVEVNSAGRKVDAETKRFVPEDEKQGSTGESTASADEQAALGADDDTPAATQDPAAATQPEQKEGDEGAAQQLQGVVIEVDPEHPLHSSRRELRAADEESAQGIRALLNGTYTRRKEVEALESKLDAIQRELVEERAQHTAKAKWQQSPEYQARRQRYFEIKDSVGPEAASEYWQGAQHDLRALVQREQDEQWGAVTETRAAEAGQRWSQEARDRATKLPEPVRTLPQFDAWFQDELAIFNIAAERGQYDNLFKPEMGHAERSEVLQKAFAQQFARRLQRQPEVNAVYATRRQEAERRQKEAEKAEAERKEKEGREREAASQAAVDGFKREAAETRRETPPHPVGAVAAAARGDHTSLDGTAEGQQDASTLSPYQAKQAARSRVREAARRRFGGR